MLIPAYCSLQFLEDISTKGQIDLVDPENLLNERVYFETVDLIFNGLIIKTDSSKGIIDEKISNPYINHLIKNARLNPAEDEFKAMRINEVNFLQDLKYPTIVFFLSGFSSAIAKQYSEESGRYFFNSDSDFNVLFEDRIQNFKPNTKIDWKFAKEFFNPHHSLLIVDPYIFKQNARKAVEELLMEIIPDKLKIKYHVTFIGSDINRKNDLPSEQQIRKWVSDMTEKISRRITCKIDYHIYNKEEFHDRYLITDNACIFSGIGVDMIKDGKVKKESTWVSNKPFKKIKTDNTNTFFIDIIHSKLSLIKSWILSSNQKISDNPLLKD